MARQLQRYLDDFVVYQAMASYKLCAELLSA